MTVEPAPAPGTAGAPGAAAGAPPADAPPRLRYRLLTGPDDHAFCQRVSDALAEGYQLYGSPAITFNGSTPIVAQAVIWPS